jgi:outer membrane protein
LRLFFPFPLVCTVAAIWASMASAQIPKNLTLQQAEQMALKNHPRLAFAALNAQAAEQVTAETRSLYFPTASVNVTSAAANEGTALAAGALTTSSLASRFATGVNLVQLVTDFGRTRDLVQTTKYRTAAENENIAHIRARLLLDVRRAYFGVLGAEAVQKAAQAALENRRLLLRQVSALAQSSLKSTLDVSFAEVLVSEAELALDQTQNNAQSNRAQLAAAMGVEQARDFVLQDENLPAPLNPDLPGLVTKALQSRPDLLVLQRNREAAYQLAQAEKKLSYPTISLLATGGVIPERDHTLPHNNYEAAGVNISIPVFNGGLFTARKSEALLRAQAADKALEDFSLQVSRDVQTAWFEANNAFHRLDVTARLVHQATQALHLAQARYDAGLGSIVELNQAQLSQTSAEINAAGAKYDYLSRRTNLDYAMGVLP